MITIFNRKEVTITFSMEEQGRIRQILSDNNIDYQVKVVDRNSPSPIATGSRARSGTFGERLDLMKEYVIYVKKEDLEQAVSLIRK